MPGADYDVNTTKTVGAKRRLFSTIKIEHPPGKKLHRKEAIRADRLEFFKYAMFVVIEFFQVIMASMLIIMVPSKCDPNPEFSTILDLGNNSTAYSPVCNTYQVFFDTQQPARSFSILVICFNFFTLTAALAHYTVVHRREKALINTLESDASVADNRLPEVLRIYPDIKSALTVLNKRSFYSGLVFLVFFVVNEALTGILLFTQRYYGYQTVTVYITNTLLMLSILYRSFKQSLEGWRSDTATSLFDYEPLKFNVIDWKYTDARDTTQGGRIGSFDGQSIPEFNHLPVVT